MKIVNETEIISLIESKFNSLKPFGIEGIGDDCAIIPISDTRSLLVSTDMLVEGSHFIIDKISARDLGYKSLASNISDISAMGANAFCSFLSVAITPKTDMEWVEQFMDGYYNLSSQCGVMLLGGDTVSSSTSVSINITVMAYSDNIAIKRRNAACTGDIIAVIDNIGDSAAGLKILLDDIYADDKSLCFLKNCHTHPLTYTKEALWLGQQQGVHAMMDISDGIAKDIRHILKLSCKGAEIHIDRIPTSDQLKDTCNRYGWDITTFSLCGGEDYSLLMTISPDSFNILSSELKQKFNIELTNIGVITDNENTILWYDNNNIIEGDPFRGFTHKTDII